MINTEHWRGVAQETGEAKRRWAVVSKQFTMMVMMSFDLKILDVQHRIVRYTS